MCVYVYERRRLRGRVRSQCWCAERLLCVFCLCVCVSLTVTHLGVLIMRKMNRFTQHANQRTPARGSAAYKRVALITGLNSVAFLARAIITLWANIWCDAQTHRHTDARTQDSRDDTAG